MCFMTPLQVAGLFPLQRKREQTEGASFVYRVVKRMIKRSAYLKTSCFKFPYSSKLCRILKRMVSATLKVMHTKIVTMMAN